MSGSGEKLARSKLTRQILFGMGIGALLGLAINLLSPVWGVETPFGEFVQTWIVDGVLAVMGQGFLRLLSVLVVPLVFVSLVCGTSALHDIKKVGRIGIKAVGLYLLTTAVAITLAISLALLVSPGKDFELETDAEFTARESPGLAEVFIDLFPRNILASMAEGNMLQLIVFALLFGLALSLAGSSGKKIAGVFEDLNSVIMRLVGIVMILAPYGVFALIARTFSGQGLDAFGPLLKYFFLVLSVLIIHATCVYPLLLRVIGGLHPWIFLRKMREVHLFAFSTASSNATIPVTLGTVEHRMGVPKPVASFTVPLGATINMDGTAIMQGVATVFIAQAYNIDLGLTQYLMVILTAVLASIGTAGVPGVGLIMLAMVLNQVGLPVEGIALILGIDRLLDMVRTAVNVTGDAMVSCLVAKSEGELNCEVFDSPKATFSPQPEES